MQDLQQVGSPPAVHLFRRRLSSTVDRNTDGFGIRISEIISTQVLDSGRRPIQSGGTNVTSGSLSANVDHYRWLADATTRNPFDVRRQRQAVHLVFWCGDPIRHSTPGDSLNSTHPRHQRRDLARPVRNASLFSDNWWTFVNARPALRDNTDIV